MSNCLNLNLKGKTFGRWTVEKSTTRKNDHRMHWICVCSCGNRKEVSERSLLRGHSRSCGCLRNEESRKKNRWSKHGKSERTEGRMLYQARRRAKVANIKCDLTINDIQIPATCPLLDIPIFPSNSIRHYHPNSPSLDRKNPYLGYVKGNVWVISYRANMIKSNASIQELKTLVRNLERQCA